MTLSSRTVALGTVYYCVLRTHPAHDFYANAAERSGLYARLDAARNEAGVRIHAFAWTRDYLRVAFEVSRLPPEEFIRHLAAENPKRATFKPASGPIFDDGYRLASLDCQFSLLELVCHVHLTPVVEGLTKQLVDYVASSYRAYCDVETIPWLTTRRVLIMLDRDTNRARRLLEECVLTHVARIRRSRGHSPITREFEIGDAGFFARLTREPSGRSFLRISDVGEATPIRKRERRASGMTSLPPGWPEELEH